VVKNFKYTVDHPSEAILHMTWNYGEINLAAKAVIP